MRVRGGLKVSRKTCFFLKFVSCEFLKLSQPGGQRGTSARGHTMWTGLTSGLSGALQSLDQAARDLTTIELEDDDDEYGEEPRALPRGAPTRQ